MHIKLRILTTLISVFALSGCSEELLNQILDANASPTTSSQPEKSTPSSLDTEAPGTLQQEILLLVNQERTKAGLNPLTLNNTLSVAAQAHAENMIATDTFAHNINGKTVGDRATAAGYIWGRVGENIAAGQNSPEQVMESWMNSEGHRANILKAEFQELGVGYAKDKEGVPYWVQVFGTLL